MVASVYAFINGVGTTPYAMAKAGVEQFGRALRVELAPHGASASVAYFGFIDTEMVRRVDRPDPLADRAVSHVPARAAEAPSRRRSPARRSSPGSSAAGPHHPPAPLAILSVLRGVLNPLIQARRERDAQVQALLKEVDGRGP